MRRLKGERVPETEEYGVSSFVFRARRPFHPGRLVGLMASVLFRSGCAGAAPGEEHPGDEDEASATAGAPAPASLPRGVLPTLLGEHGVVVRSKGAVWIAAAEGSTCDAMGAWSQSGRLLELEPAAPWAALKEQHAAACEAAAMSGTAAAALPPFARFTELVIIGLSMDGAAVRAALEACLVTESEFAAGPGEWGGWENPIWGHLGP